MDTALKIIGIVLTAAGAITVYAAGYITRKFRLAEKVNFNSEAKGSGVDGSDANEERMLDSGRPDSGDNLSGVETDSYNVTKTIVNVKMAGMLIALPGLVLILLKF